MTTKNEAEQKAWAQHISDGALASLGKQPEPIPWIKVHDQGQGEVACDDCGRDDGTHNLDVEH